MGFRQSDSRAHTHNHYSCGEHNLELNFYSTWKSEVLSACHSLSILLSTLVFLSWNHISHFHILFFSFIPHMPLVNCTLIPFWLLLWDNFITASWANALWMRLITAPFLDLLCWCRDASIKLIPDACLHLFFMPLKEWETLYVIPSKSERIGYAFIFKISFILVHKHRGCVKNIDYIIWQVQIWMFDQWIRFHWNKAKQKIQVRKINSQTKRSVLLFSMFVLNFML